MNFSVLVEPCEGKFKASLAGVPNIRVLKPSRSEAISAIETKIHKCVEQGDLLSLEIFPTGISSLAGKYKTDPTIHDISTNAYQVRDSENKL